MTGTGPFGESIASAEFTLLATVNHSANILFTPPAAATGYRLYRGTVTATENVLVMTGGCTGGVAATVVDIGSAGGAPPPPPAPPPAPPPHGGTPPPPPHPPPPEPAPPPRPAGGRHAPLYGAA